jgi:hypothetical protein
MAKMTLLEMVQNILSALDSDEVNSISDTVEASQVAEIIKESYYDLLPVLDVPERKALFYLDPVGSTKPTLMSIPSDLSSIDWIKYDYRESGTGDYRHIQYVHPEDFLDILNPRVGQDNVEQYTINNTYITVYNDKNPTYWTTFDDDQIVFDSYDNDLDANLQAAKSQVWGTRDPGWTAEDDFVPLYLDSNMFPTLLAEAKSVSFINLKQVSSAKEEQRSRRGLIRTQNERNKARGSYFDRLPNYSRRRR